MKLAVSLAVTSLVGLGAAGLADDNYRMADGRTCPRDGSTTNAKLQALDRDKNRSAEPSVDDIDTDVTLAAMLAPGEDQTRFEGVKAARVVGFVVKVKAGEAETCNCKATDPVDRDTHIELALTPDALANQRVVVEVSPRQRLRIRNDHARQDQPRDWTTKALQSHGAGGVAGKWVEVTGWLLFDREHTGIAENTTPGRAGNIRATCWEVHPITDIRILDGPPANSPALASVTLRQMQQAHAAQASRDPARVSAIAARNKENNELFAEDKGPEPPQK